MPLKLDGIDRGASLEGALTLDGAIGNALLDGRDYQMSNE